jgi:hypothetical protein
MPSLCERIQRRPQAQNSYGPLIYNKHDGEQREE